MAHIFISYSRKDEDFARKLAQSLSELGGDIWIDVEDIPAGMNWSSAIQQGLQFCDVMIVILTPGSAASRNVEEEWQYYRDKGKPIIPVLLQPAEVHYQLSRTQYIDFHTQDYDTALRQLHTQLRHKGVVLKPISASEKSVPIPAQKPLPVRGARQRRYWVIGAAVAVAVLVIAIVGALNNRGQGGQPTLTAAATTQEVAQVVTTTPTDIPTATKSQTPEPTLDIVYVVETLDAQGTASVRATRIAASATQIILFQYATVTEIAGQTATATLWTDTPTPDITASIDAFQTQRANDARATNIAGQTATATRWTATPTVTYTPTKTPTATYTPSRTPTNIPTPRVNQRSLVTCVDGVAEVDLLESWMVSDDLLTWTFRLKEGIRLANGELLTSSRIRDEFLSKFSGMSVELVDDFTVKINLAQPESMLTFPCKLSQISIAVQ